ncbi:tetratricopeptide repeat protein [uncultured Ferrovibrio sp.]|uniref:tetratricopeptide repeat protein n=1 Tax=uncultured Ferrovibrio sp. TaxID=1576913 RepID=UPI00262E4C7B|nr:tetratricopeptide repeat protein [uncultured Ferrovibrio sp.]
MTASLFAKSAGKSLRALLLGASLALPLLPAVSWAQDARPTGAFAAGVQAFEAGNYEAAYQAWLPLAQHGDVAAMRNIGHLYRWGQGVPQDMNQAIAWYRRAAEMGFARAQANLAAIYLQGEGGVPVDYAEALKWFDAAAKQGHAVAQYNLGLMYELGLGVEKNEAAALGWYNNAAKAGQPDALERLSLLVMRREAAPSDKPDPAAAKIEPQAAPAPAQSAPVPPAPAPAPPAQASEPSQSAQPAPRMVEEPLPQLQVEPATVENRVPVEDTAKEKKAGDDAREGRSLLGSFYSAITSGGGVSLPDLFSLGDDAAQTDAKPEGGQSGGKGSQP